MPNKRSNQWKAEAGANAKAMSIMMELMRFPKLDLYDAGVIDDLNEVCDRYLAFMQQQDYRASRESFALALHVYPKTLTKMINGTKGGRPLPRDVHEKLLEMDAGFQMLTADGMLSGDNNVIGAIFELKNNWGYRDQTEVVTVHKTDALTGDELKALADSLPEVIDAEYHDVQAIGVKDEETEEPM